MVRTAAAPALLAFLAFLSACGGSDQPAAEPAPGASGAAAGVGEPVSVPWRLDSAQGPLLELRVVNGGCVSFQNVDVVETAKAVTVTAYAVPDDSSCGQEVTQEQVPASLEKPLGKRRLVHAPVDAEWEGKGGLGPDTR